MKEAHYPHLSRDRATASMFAAMSATTNRHNAKRLMYFHLFDELAAVVPRTRCTAPLLCGVVLRRTGAPVLLVKKPGSRLCAAA
jgi:hypothetical protein